MFYSHGGKQRDGKRERERGVNFPAKCLLDMRCGSIPSVCACLCVGITQIVHTTFFWIRSKADFGMGGY